MNRTWPTGMARQRGRPIPALLITVFLAGMFLAAAIPKFQQQREAGLGVAESIFGSLLPGAISLGAVVLGLLLLNLLIGMYVFSKRARVGKQMKVPYGKFRGQPGVIEGMPQNDGLVRMRLTRTGAVLLVPLLLFDNPEIFDGEGYRWLKEGVRVRVRGIHDFTGHIDFTGRIEKHDEDTQAVLVLRDDTREAIWLSPHFLEKW